MLVSVLPVPFADAAFQRQYDALQAALAAEAAAPATVLLGNLAAFTSLQVDALIVRPGGLALVVLVPRRGHLTAPTLTYGTWQLDGHPLPGRAGADNPFAQYRQQLPAALAWLAEQLPLAQPPAQLGLALFEGPLTLSPEVAEQLQQAEGPDFYLLGEAAQAVTILKQTLDLEYDAITEDELLDWADYLAASQPAPGEPGDAWPGAEWLVPKLRQLWRWLGAEDIPADPPYGASLPTDHAARDQQEQARLAQLRHELQAALQQQRHEAALREAAHEQDLAQLRQQLSEAGLPAAERRAEQQAQAALEDSLRTMRAELAERTAELDARIRQLGPQLQPATAPPLPARPGSSQVRLAPRPVAGRSFRRLRQAERWGLVVLGLAIAGTGTVAALRALHPAPAHPVAGKPRRGRASRVFSSAEDATPAPVVVYDTVARSPAPARDTAAKAPAPPAAELAPKPTPADSARPAASPSPAPAAADSAATDDEPTP